MIKLPTVTLCCFTGLGYKTQEHINVLNKSREGLEFGEVKLIQLGSIIDIGTWNEAIIKQLPKYIETSHCLLMHDDSAIINPHLWNNEWLTYDFAGSPWPLPTDNYSYRDEEGKLQRVGNSVGLRSKKLMDLIATRPMEYHYGNNNEDGQICTWNRKWLESQGCKFMPFEEAIYFGKEAPLPENKGVDTFLIHKYGY